MKSNALHSGKLRVLSVIARELYLNQESKQANARTRTQ